MQVLQRWLRYGFEGLLLYLFFVPFYIRLDQLPPIIPYLTVYLFSAFLLFLLFRNRSVSYSVLFAAVPVFAALAWMIGFPLLLAAGLAIVCCWRIAVHFFHFSDPFEGVGELVLFLWVFVLALFLYIFFPSYAYHDGILVIVILIYLVAWDENFPKTCRCRCREFRTKTNVFSMGKRCHYWFDGAVCFLSFIVSRREVGVFHRFRIICTNDRDDPGLSDLLVDFPALFKFGFRKTEPSI